MLKYFLFPGNIELIKNFRKTFSFKNALILYFGICRDKELIKIDSKRIKIHIRKDTKDKETFLEVFSDLIYNTSFYFEPKTIVDAGSNVGYASMFFKFKFPEAEIAALEIESENLKFLKKNMSNFSNVQVYEKALHNKTTNFKIDNPYNANNSFVIREVGLDEEFDIQSITLDEIMKERNWTHIDILKIDIEGSEKDLFSKDYENWLPKTKVIYIETHDRMVERCFATVTNTINKYKEFILFTTTTGTLVYYNTNFMKISN